MKKDIIPPDAVVAELKRKAAECEQKAGKEEEPRATELRDGSSASVASRAASARPSFQPITFHEKR
jgi:hypothetical protein